MPRSGDHIEYLWMPENKWCKGKVLRRVKTKIKFFGDSDASDMEPWSLPLDEGKWKFLDKPDSDYNTSENSDSEPETKTKKAASKKKKTRKRKPTAEPSTKRLPPWKAFGDMTESVGFSCVHQIWATRGRSDRGRGLRPAAGLLLFNKNDVHEAMDG